LQYENPPENKEAKNGCQWGVTNQLVKACLAGGSEIKGRNKSHNDRDQQVRIRDLFRAKALKKERVAHCAAGDVGSYDQEKVEKHEGSSKELSFSYLKNTVQDFTNLLHGLVGGGFDFTILQLSWPSSVGL